MKREVIISIEGRQSFSGGEAEVIRTTARGALEDLGPDGVVLTYREGEDTGLEGTLTTLRVEPRRVILERTGALDSRMIFERGCRHSSAYHTPYGTLNMVVCTQNLRSDLDGQGGELSVDYDLELDGAKLGRNALRIQVRPAR